MGGRSGRMRKVVGFAHPLNTIAMICDHNIEHMDIVSGFKSG